jgi:acyl carrier protein phosphodiesterase
VNYLAHAYLSFEDPEVVTGNLISDFVKGKKKYDYPPRILFGINLHRQIDAYTDEHPVNREASKIFKGAYGLYAAAFLDVTYDHFLARELAGKDNEKFNALTITTYAHIASFDNILPLNFRNIFPYMRHHNWLFNYQFSWGIQNSFEGLAHRAKYISEGKTAFELFNKNYEALRRAYDEFFPQLLNFSLGKFSDIH